MELSCRQCSVRFRAAVELPLVEAVRVMCPTCKRQMVLRPAPGARAPAPRVPAPSSRRKIAVIADEPRPFRDFLAGELRGLGFDVELFESGSEALDYVQEKKAELVILNVYLKGRLGVEISEDIKADDALSKTRVVLIGALFRANRFRANPTNLYGADEYIEEQIPSQELQQIVRKLFPDLGPVLKKQEVQSKEFDEARRLARLILSDIVIHNVEQVERGIRDGTFFELLADEIKEGRDYYESRVPPIVREIANFFNETLEQFVQMKRDELGNPGSGVGRA